MELIDVFKGAKEALAKYGWTQGAWHCSRGVCAEGAINAAILGEPSAKASPFEHSSDDSLLAYTAIGIVDDLVADETDNAYVSVMAFNDTGPASAESVSALFDRAAAKVAEDEKLHAALVDDLLVDC